MRLGTRTAEAAAEATSDEFSRIILSAPAFQGKTVDEMCRAEGTPHSTCCRRIRRLVDEGVMVVERIVVTSAGKRYSVYRSTFTRLDVRLEEGGAIAAYGVLNAAAAHKVRGASCQPDSFRPLPRETARFIMRLGFGPRPPPDFQKRGPAPLRPSPP